ncbi:MAG TPA: DUF3299 domain-containing protein [Candidatus Hydrogenedentes bacterium]|nr:DUF3299 domain-containing protein [Candidatus Hydrogenedentota bacterium]
MRRRAKRDLVTLLGIVVIVASIVGVNGYLRRAGLREHYERLRAMVETKHRNEGVTLLEWKELHQVTGRRATGASFPESLKEKDGRLVNIVGFMNPIDQFRNVTEFMLLPVPIVCYFCDAPPMRDIIQVKLREPANMVNEPVLIGGRLRLHEGERPLFFYTIEDALWNEAVEDEETTEKVTEQQHRLHLIEGFGELRGESGLLDEPEEELLPGYTPPTELPEE